MGIGDGRGEIVLYESKEVSGWLAPLKVERVVVDSDEILTSDSNEAELELA